jgi:PAS domain S-box-containing protein
LEVFDWNREAKVQNSKNGEFDKSTIDQNALLQSMIEGMILQDSAGLILQFNQAALDILGISQEELKEQLKEHNSSPEKELNEWDKIFPGKNHIGMNSIKTGVIQRNIVLQIFRPEGEIRWISLNAVPIFDENKIPYQLICTFTDITKTRQTLNDLKQTQLLYNISHDLMIITNYDGFFKRINPRFTNVIGYTLTEIISQKFINFVHPEDLALTETEMSKLSLEKKTIHFINRYRTKQNDYRIFDWVVVPEIETNLIYFTARDITEYRSDELEVIHSSKVYSIGELTTGLTYLLAGQLSIISGHISFIQSRIDHGQIDLDDLKNKIHNIENSILKLSKTTKELTSFSRNIENESVSNVSLKRIIDSIIGLCKERFRIHGVKLETKLEDDLFIHSKESQIAHILIRMLNIAYNEVHAQRESWVELSVKLIDKKVRISITDSNKWVEEPNEKKINLPRGIVEENFGIIYFDHSSPYTRFIIEFPTASE